MKLLEVISDHPDFDRPFINNHFTIVFPEKYLKKQIKKRLTREEVLKKFRESDRHKIMKGTNASIFRF